jgi:hypothetical protein
MVFNGVCPWARRYEVTVVDRCKCGFIVTGPLTLFLIVRKLNNVGGSLSLCYEMKADWYQDLIDKYHTELKGAACFCVSCSGRPASTFKLSKQRNLVGVETAPEASLAAVAAREPDPQGLVVPLVGDVAVAVARDKGYLGKGVALTCRVLDGGVFVSHLFLGRVVHFVQHAKSQNSDKWVVLYNDKEQKKLGFADVEARIKEHDSLSEEEREVLDNLGEIKMAHIMAEYAAYMRRIERHT